MEADSKTEELVGVWHDHHVENKLAEFRAKLARSSVVELFDHLDLDILHTRKYGSIARQHRKGEVDYKALAIAKLGAARVEELEEQFRKPASNPVTAPNTWSAEAGLPS